MKTLELTDDQYKQLVKLTFIGEWILNAKTAIPDYKEEEALTNHIYSNCKKFGLSNWFDQYGDDWELKEEFAFDFISLVEDFSYDDFWMILVKKLTERDLAEIYLDNESKGGKELDNDDYEDLLDEHEEFYSDEFEENDILNLRLARQIEPSQN